MAGATVAPGRRGGQCDGSFWGAQLNWHHSLHRGGNMKKKTVTEVSKSAKPAAGIAIVAALPSWKRRKAGPFALSGVTASSLILEERKDGR